MEKRELRLVEVWTDGGLRPTGDPQDAVLGGGVVMRCEGRVAEWAVPLGRGTNNGAELGAIRWALQKLKKRPGLHVVLRTDSQWCVGALTKNWAVTKHVPLLLEIRRLMAEFGKIELHWVKGHAGDEHNRRADQLAGLAAREGGE